MVGIIIAYVEYLIICEITANIGSKNGYNNGTASKINMVKNKARVPIIKGIAKNKISLWL